MSKSTPVISIITVVYNGGETLEHTVRSVVQQTYQHVQYIVIDGGSTDNTLEILQRYRQDIAVLISEKDDGIYDAMNKGLQHATGDWAYFLGADDLLSIPTIIEELVEHFKDPDSIYYGDTYLKSRNRLYNGKVTTPKFLLCNISHQAIFYPKSIFQKKNYNVRYKYFADHVHNLEIYAEDATRFVYLPRMVSIYNDQGRSSTLVDENYATDIVNLVSHNFGPGLGAYVWLRRKVAKFKRKLLR